MGKTHFETRRSNIICRTVFRDQGRSKQIRRLRGGGRDGGPLCWEIMMDGLRRLYAVDIRGGLEWTEEICGGWTLD